jgi:hypothetical protein
MKRSRLHLERASAWRSQKKILFPYVLFFFCGLLSVFPESSVCVCQEAEEEQQQDQPDEEPQQDDEEEDYDDEANFMRAAADEEVTRVVPVDEYGEEITSFVPSSPLLSDSVDSFHS